MERVTDQLPEGQTRTSEGLKAQEVFEVWRQSPVAVFGLGAGGSKAVEQFFEAGARQFFFSDPDSVEQKNLENQVYDNSHVGKTKAEALYSLFEGRNGQETCIAYDDLGVVPENMQAVEIYIANSAIVFDGIDPDAFPASMAVHELARKYQKPVIVPLDIGEQASCLVYRYDLFPDMPVMRGKIKPEDIEEYQFVEALYFDGHISKAEKIGYIYEIFAGVLGYHTIPEEFLDLIVQPSIGEIPLSPQAKNAINKLLGYQEETKAHEHIPQLGRIADATAILVAKVAEEILMGRKVRDRASFDLGEIVSRRSFNPLKPRELGGHAVGIMRRSLKPQLARLFLKINRTRIRQKIKDNDEWWVY